MPSETTTADPAPRPDPPPPGATRSPRVGRRTLIIATVVVGVVIVVVAGIALMTRSSSKPRTAALGAAATPAQAKAMAMCGVVAAALDDPAAQAEPELARRVQAVLKVGGETGDRYQAAVVKLGQASGTGDTAGMVQGLKDLQALCQPSAPG